MSTRCRIAINDGDSFRSIYCHYDGYPEYMGRQLPNHYNTTEIVNELINLGDISFLMDTIDETRPLSYYEKGEDLVIKSSPNLASLLGTFMNSDEEYLYLWDNNKWKLLNKHKVKDQLLDMVKETINNESI